LIQAKVNKFDGVKYLNNFFQKLKVILGNNKEESSRTILAMISLK
jgi:hypothetical protein